MEADVTEHMIRNLVGIVTDKSRPLQARLEAAALLSTMPDCDEACAELLDTLPPTTAMGRGLREVLVTTGQSVDALCVLLWEGVGPTRRAAVERLGELGAAAALRELCVLLSVLREGDRRTNTQPLILQVLDAISCCWRPGAVVAAQSVACALGDGDVAVRLVASATLRRMGGDAAAASDTLIALLQSPDTRVRFSVAELLPELTPPSVYVPWMVRLMHEEDDELIRWIARYELSRLPMPPAGLDEAVLAA
jgi:HEAT repeat protein